MDDRVARFIKETSVNIVRSAVYNSDQSPRSFFLPLQTPSLSRPFLRINLFIP